MTYDPINNKVYLCLTCIRCRRGYDLEVKAEDYRKYRDGELVQNCFPYLTSGQRELFISGICDDCWNEMFKGEESK